MSEVIRRKGGATWGGIAAPAVRGFTPVTAVRCSDTRLGVSLRTVWPDSSCHTLQQCEPQSGGGAIAGFFIDPALASRRLDLSIMRVRHTPDRPNKAPEPTPGSVTPRASSR